MQPTAGSVRLRGHPLSQKRVCAAIVALAPSSAGVVDLPLKSAQDRLRAGNDYRKTIADKSRPDALGVTSRGKSNVFCFRVEERAEDPFLVIYPAEVTGAGNDFEGLRVERDRHTLD